jgi:hypothetical protein
MELFKKLLVVAIASAVIADASAMQPFNPDKHFVDGNGQVRHRSGAHRNRLAQNVALPVAAPVAPVAPVDQEAARHADEARVMNNFINGFNRPDAMHFDQEQVVAPVVAPVVVPVQQPAQVSRMAKLAKWVMNHKAEMLTTIAVGGIRSFMALINPAFSVSVPDLAQLLFEVGGATSLIAAIKAIINR